MWGKKNVGFEKILVRKKIWVQKNFGQKKILLWKIIWLKIFWGAKKINIKKLWARKKILGPKKSFGQKILVPKTNFAFKIFIVVLVLLVTWVLWTPFPLKSAKRPWVVYVSNFRLLVHPVLIDFGEGCYCCDRGEKQSQLLVPGLKSRLWTLDWSLTTNKNQKLKSWSLTLKPQSCS